MGIKFANNISTTLSAGISASDVSIPVASATGMPSLSAGDWFYATLSNTAESTWEIIKVTGISSNTLTATRGQDNTTAVEWTSGSTLSIRPCAAAMEDVASSSVPQSLSVSITQTAHGFAVLTPIFYDIDANAWAKAKADSADTLATHVVTAVADADNFTAGQIGKFTVTSHGLAEGYWFTSATTAGGVTQDDQSYSNPVFFVLDADTVILLGYRPSSSNWDSFMFPGEVSVTGAITLGVGSIGKLHVCSGAAADYAVILPTPVGHRGELIAFDMDAALTKIVTLDAGVGLTINGERYRKMWAKENCILRSNGTEWQKIAGVSIPMSAKMRLAADQTFSANTSTVLAVDTLGYLDAPSAMMNLATHSFLCLRSGKYHFGISARFQAYGGAGARVLWLASASGHVVNTTRKLDTLQSSSVEITHCEDDAALVAGMVLQAIAFSYTTNTPTIYGDTTVGTHENSFALTEIPTW